MLSDKDCAIKCRDTPMCLSAYSMAAKKGVKPLPCVLYNKTMDGSKIQYMQPEYGTKVFVKSNTIPDGATLVNF